MIGQTFTFGVYVEKDNASAEGVCYKVGKVWKDLKLLKIGDNSESGSAPSSSFVSEVRHVYDPMFFDYLVEHVILISL